MDKFIVSLISDIKYQIEYFAVKEISTVYIGGGTPSVMGAVRFRVLLDAIKTLPAIKPIEFTTEANPESADEELLSVLKEGGVNRLSLGVQSFHEASRLAVKRKGNPALLQERLSLCSRYFPDALCADLITGLPYQSEKIVIDDIKRLLDCSPVHVSLYSLILEKETPLYKKVKTKAVAIPTDDGADALWLAGKEALEKAGLRHYEVSNFAKDGKRCLHNMRYWRMEGWLGAGPAASGTIVNEETGTAKRFTFAPDLPRYIKEPLVHGAIYEELDKTALLKESLLMGYRCCEGPDAELFKKRFGFSIEDCIPQTLKRWKGRDKMLFLNSFLTEAFVELEMKED